MFLKKLRIILMLATACFGVSSVIAQSGKRSGVIVDTAGVQSDVRKIEFYSDCYAHFALYGPCFVRTPGFEVAVPIESVTSIVADGKNHKVRYIWMGQERELLGIAEAARFEGDSDFGRFTLALEKLKQITFKTPAENATKPAKALEATVTLSNGRVLPAKNVQRYASYHSTAGFIVGGRTRYDHLDDFTFLRGESLARLPFDQISVLAFNGSAVTVTSKNGNSASGKLSTGGEASLHGFTWIGEDSYYFAEPAQVKSIQFQK